MPLLVDGYNVTHASLPPRFAGMDEAWLCRLLGTSPWARGGITVVCDGRPKPGGATVSPVNEVTLVYSGQGRSADDVIREMIQAETAPRRLTVVSNDREIQKAARRRRCRVLASDRLISTLASQARKRSSAATSEELPGKKVSPLTDSETRHWLNQFGVEPDEDDRPERPWWEYGLDER